MVDWVGLFSLAMASGVVVGVGLTFHGWALRLVLMIPSIVLGR